MDSTESQMKITPARDKEWMAAACAVVSALLLFAVFPPLEWTWAAAVALVPLLGIARRLPARMALKWVRWPDSFSG